MEPQEERLEAFCTEYMGKYEDAGAPRDGEVEEAFCAAFEEEEIQGVPENLQVLRQFFRQKIAEGIPLNWFCGEGLRWVKQAHEIAQECVMVGERLAPQVQINIVGSNIREFGLGEEEEFRNTVMSGVLQCLISHHGPDILGPVSSGQLTLDTIVADVLERGENVTKTEVRFSGLGGRIYMKFAMSFEKIRKNGS